MMHSSRTRRPSSLATAAGAVGTEPELDVQCQLATVNNYFCNLGSPLWAFFRTVHFGVYIGALYFLNSHAKDRDSD